MAVQTTQGRRSADPVLSGSLAERAFLEALVARGLCSRAKCDALLAWPGVRSERLAHELWPSHVGRWVNHVKVVCGDAEPRAKAYLCVHHARRGARPS